MKKILLSIAASSLLIVNFANAKDYVVDTAHSQVGFKIKHMQISNVKGNFNKFSGDIDFDENTKKLKKLNATIAIDSVNTNNNNRDNHLKQADYFDAKKFPEMKFEMTEFIAESQDEGKVKGNLTIKGVTKPITLDYDFGGEIKNDKADKIGFTLEGKIDRTAFGVGESSVALGSEVKLEIEIEANAK
ncbi:polyisoprenoid-binding protein [Campylobacter sp. FMV-PI01]|uniref:Polyisoprenoid-binding protein n=1 Tax=Campylobacter portucalensis TaxID=2608384 RepID=A0A6L5WJ85_9BACT|nr:YceI family protein [Campylobacter portucalensis]MSN97006.1 polyisoprenoid-binding protein [Campylobacter portucalensis]